MRTVLFASVHDAARSKMAEAFFNRFTLPSLVRAVSGGTEPALAVTPDAVQVMSEIGFDLNVRPQLLRPELAKSAAIIVTFGLAPGWHAPEGIPRQSWDAQDLRAVPLERLREVRDSLRERVWKLVAKEGWYRLQPARLARFAKTEPAANV
jgi:arsenate reductase (thioredoxin)